MKTAELTGAALDWAVAKCEKHEVFTRPIANAQQKHWVGIVTHDYQMSREGPFTPSTDWAQGGPIIERECICTYASGACSVTPKNPDYWVAEILGTSGMTTQYGPTPLIAAMRCFVSSHLGDEIEIPKELK